MARRKKEKSLLKEKKTPTKVRPIPRKHSGKVTEPWAIMEKLIAEVEQFAPLKVAKIKLWWQKDWKADVDGIAVGAQVCKASEIDRNLAEESSGETVDLFIKLPETQWPALDDVEKEHRLFHELCHIKQAKNSNGEQKRDEKDRLLWRLAKHPITAFFEELERYGYEAVIEHNQKILESISHAERPMEKIFDEAESGPAETDQPTSEASANPDAWKRYKISRLKDWLTEKAWDALEGSSVQTLGDLQDRMTNAGEFWHSNIGVHGRFKIQIEDAFNAFQIDEANKPKAQQVA